MLHALFVYAGIAYTSFIFPYTAFSDRISKNLLILLPLQQRLRRIGGFRFFGLRLSGFRRGGFRSFLRLLFRGGTAAQLLFQRRVPAQTADGDIDEQQRDQRPLQPGRQLDPPLCPAARPAQEPGRVVIHLAAGERGQPFQRGALLRHP